MDVEETVLLDQIERDLQTISTVMHGLARQRAGLQTAATRLRTGEGARLVLARLEQQGVPVGGSTSCPTI